MGKRASGCKSNSQQQSSPFDEDPLYVSLLSVDLEDVMVCELLSQAAHVGTGSECYQLLAADMGVCLVAVGKLLYGARLLTMSFLMMITNFSTYHTSRRHFYIDRATQLEDYEWITAVLKVFFSWIIINHVLTQIWLTARHYCSLTEVSAKLTCIHTYQVSILYYLFICGCHFVLPAYLLDFQVYTGPAATTKRKRKNLCLYVRGVANSNSFID